MIRVCPIRAADQLAAYFKPMKVMYLNSKGGLINEKGKVRFQENSLHVRTAYRCKNCQKQEGF